MITSIIHKSGTIEWLHYMTSWNYMLVAFYFLFAFFKLLLYRNWEADIDQHSSWNQNGDEPAINNDSMFLSTCEEGFPLISSSEENEFLIGLTTTDKIYWFLFSTSYAMCFMVSLVFWILLYNPTHFQEELDLFITIDRHGVILIAIIFQYAMNRIPVRILHAMYVILIALVFFVHTYFYYLSTGNLVYEIFDWRNSSGKTVGVAIGLAGAISVLQVLLFLFDLLKNKIGSK